jgi:hypothetical protein
MAIMDPQFEISTDEMKARQIQTKAGRWAEDNNIAQNWRKIMNI